MISRLFQIVYLLMEKTYITAEELSERLEVSTRTIYRDLDKLSAAGIPVYTNRGRSGGISLLSDFVLDKTVLTLAERERILESLQALAAVGYQEEGEALRKLQSFFGGDSQDWIEVDFSGWSEDEKQRDYFEQFRRAIIHHCYIRIDYAGVNAEAGTRLVRPLKLCFRGQAWYLYAFCELRKDYRFFKLKRIMGYEMTQKTFEPEQVGRLMGDNLELQKKNKKTIITLKVEKEMAFRAYEELHGITTNEDKSLTCVLEVTDMNWCMEYLLTFGSYAEVLEPKEIRTKMKNMIHEMIRKYED
ncbi:MAG TPA: YafY family protein [Lachnospiraceae bacterium]|nr:YafY family protein [Lachnospiraceae bacterium]HPF29896.1 YafY family protein [Lachnospiraceae bacterium]